MMMMMSYDLKYIEIHFPFSLSSCIYIYIKTFQILHAYSCIYEYGNRFNFKQISLSTYMNIWIICKARIWNHCIYTYIFIHGWEAFYLIFEIYYFHLCATLFFSKHNFLGVLNFKLQNKKREIVFFQSCFNANLYRSL